MADELQVDDVKKLADPDPFDPASLRISTDYAATVGELIEGLQRDNHPLAVEIASVPEKIRGYGYIKARNLTDARQCEADLMAAWRAPAMRATAAE